MKKNEKVPHKEGLWWRWVFNCKWMPVQVSKEMQFRMSDSVFYEDVKDDGKWGGQCFEPNWEPTR